MTDADILALVTAAFGACPRPEHFTDFRHCCECAEHDAALCARDVESLSMEDVGYPSWDPLSFTSADGLLYLMPALARLSMEQPDAKLGWYAPQLQFHLTYDGPKNRILCASNTTQRRAVVALLEHLVATRAAWCESADCREELLDAAELWRGETP